MISKISNRISQALYKAQVIQEAEMDLYVYGFFVLLSQGLFFLISAFFGFMLGVFWESAAFYIMFSILRSYAGGFHASSEIVCVCCTTLALLLSSVLIYVMREVSCNVILLCILLLSSAAVYLLSPLDSEDKPLSFSELCDYRRKSRGIVTGLTLLAICSLAVGCFGTFYAATVSIVLESILLVLGRANRFLKLAKDY